MADRSQQLTLTVSADLVRNCSGISMDIGGSAAKIIYRTKEEWQRLLENKDCPTGTLHLLTCSRLNMDPFLDDVLQKTYINPDNKIYTCGLGGFQNHLALKGKMGDRVENIGESDCLVDALKYFISKVPEREIFYPPLVDDINETNKDMMDRMALHAKMYKDSKNKFFTTDFTLEDADGSQYDASKSVHDILGDDLYPCLIVHLGSNHGYLRIEKDGTPKFCEATTRGGRCFLGVASMLTGIKSYDEFIDLAEKGDNLNVDQSIHSLSEYKDKDKDGPYNSLSESKNQQVAYSFGRAVFQDPGSFRKEDLALSWLMQHVTDVVGCAHHAVASYNIKHVFVAGSMANRELVRKHITREMIRQDCMMVSAYQRAFQPKVRFMRHGGHLGSFGALLRSSETK